MVDTKIYTIPLRREFQKASFKRKTNKAVKATKEFLLKHTKADKVLLGEELNEQMWEKGITNPPAKVKVEVTIEIIKKDNIETKVAFANLVGFGKKVIKQDKKGILSKENTGLQGKLKEAVKTLKGTKSDESKKEESKDEKTKDVKVKSDSKTSTKDSESSASKKVSETKEE